MAYGQDGHFGFSFQDSLGTANVDSMDYFPIINETITHNIEELRSEELSARIDEPDDYLGMEDMGGDVVTEVHPSRIGKFLKAVCGQATVDYQGSCYEHTFLPLQEDWQAEVCALPPITTEIYRDTGSACQYFDMVCNGLVFEAAQASMIKVTASFIGGQFAWINKTTPSYDAGSNFPWDVVSVSLAGSAVSIASNLTVGIQNNIEGKGYLDLKRYASRFLRNDFRTVEIAGTMLLVGDDEQRNYKAGTRQRLIMAATDPTTIMNAHNQLIIDVPKMKYSNFPDNIGGPNLIDVSFEARGKWDQTSEYSIKYTLVNTRAAY